MVWAMKIVTRPYQKARKRIRDPRIVSRYHEVRGGLLCEWCSRSPATELNHILHGSKKEDAPWNFQLLCHACHQDPRIGFHGSEPLFTVADALRVKLKQGFMLPREAWAYLDGVDACPGTEQSIEEQFQLVERLANLERSR